MLLQNYGISEVDLCRHLMGLFGKTDHNEIYINPLSLWERVGVRVKNTPSFQPSPSRKEGN